MFTVWVFVVPLHFFAAKSNIICKQFVKLNSIFSQRPGVTPPFVGDTVSASGVAYDALFQDSDENAVDEAKDAVVGTSFINFREDNYAEWYG